MKILIIEDETGIRDVYKEFFFDRGYEVYEASEAEEGINIFKDKKPEIILCDILLPGHQGYYAMRAIRDISEKPFIVALTIMQEHHAIEQAYKSGADIYMAKPVHLKTLVKFINMMFNEGN